MMTNKALETWAWVLIYAGLLLVMLGFFVQTDGGAGWLLKLLGALVVAPGVLMIAIRSRRPREGD